MMCKSSLRNCSAAATLSCSYQPGVTFLAPPNGWHQTPCEKREILASGLQRVSEMFHLMQSQPTRCAAQIVSSSLVYLFDTWRTRSIYLQVVGRLLSKGMATDLAHHPMVQTFLMN